MMIPKDYEQNTKPTLNDFPKSLRKLGLFMLENEDILTVTEAIRKGNFNYDSITTMISRERKKGRDFKKFMNGQLQNLLNGQKLKVANALIQGAVSDSHADRKLYFQLTGDLKETTVNNQITLNMGFIPVHSQEQDTGREIGVIDVKPFIPKGK
jgi:hypothetical protein